VPDIAKLLWPRTVALIGASSDTHGLRGRILRVMKGHPFAGAIYPVSRSQAQVQGLKAFPAVADVPELVDLAVLIIPAKHVPDELERCGKVGIKAAVILSSGFAEEAGAAGASLQDDIRAIANRYDMAVNGPNSEGFANTALALCPTFSPVMEAGARALLPPEGRYRGQIAVVAQSGGVGFAFFDRGRPRELAFRYIVTTGNEVGLEAFDYVDHMLDEGKTDAFLLWLEDVKSPETFRRVAAKALRAGKPLIVTKIGRSEPGRRAAQSHTAALAGSYAAYQAMFARYGVIEGEGLDQMIEVAAAFLAFGGRLPAGRRVAICTSSGGCGGWLADAAAAAGLDVPQLDAATRAAIDVHLPPYGTSQNPVDVTAQAVFKVGYAEFGRLLVGSPAIDGVLIVASTRRSEVIAREREALAALARETAKPILFWSYTPPADDSVAIMSEAGFPLFTDMHNCARTMRHMADYRAVRERFLRPAEIYPAVPRGRKKAGRILAASHPVLCEYEARPLLAAYGIAEEDPIGSLARSADEAEAAARVIGVPVALKVQSPDIPHKTEAGALALGVMLEAVPAAYHRVLANAKRHVPGAHILGVLVQPMAPPGREVILGIKRDDLWGPMLLVGLGGVLVEVLGDVALSPVPFGPQEARALLARLKGAALLEAHRGAPAADVDALVDLMICLAQFAADHVDEVAEVDLNPVLVHPEGQGISVVDALIVKRAVDGRELLPASDRYRECRS
jgi:acyl-CoA synthetase (NDP forming)